jgi:hypothetical protein
MLKTEHTFRRDAASNQGHGELGVVRAVGKVRGMGKQTNKQTPWPLVRERTIPTEPV